MPRVFKIALGETAEIPANCEMISSGIFSENTPHFSTAMVEEYTNKLAEEGIFVAKSVIDTYNQVIPLRLLNLNDFPTKLYKNETAAVRGLSQKFVDNMYNFVQTCGKSISRPQLFCPLY